MMELLRAIGPLSRTLASVQTDQAFSLVQAALQPATQGGAKTAVESYPTGEKVWTWTIPPRWELQSASIKFSGKQLLDGTEHPLATVNYSQPFRGRVTKTELLRHLHSAPQRPSARPFVFSFYQEQWGFCVSENWLQEFRLQHSDDSLFDVEIDSRFEAGDFKVLASFLPGESRETFVICSNICHPGQVNDSLTGLAASVDLAARLAAREKRKYSYLFLIVPETIGSIAYFAHHPEMIERAVGGLFSEMLGTTGPMVGQLSRDGATYWDRALQLALGDWQTKTGESTRCVPFLKSAANDEKVMDSPGVNIPTVSVTRYPYPEYHTSDDCVELIDAKRLADSRDLLLNFIDWIEADYVPCLVHPGPVFLSGYDLYPDWRSKPELKPKWDAFIDVMYAIDGKRSVVELAYDLKCSPETVRYWCDGFAGKGLLTKQPKLVRREIAP